MSRDVPAESAALARGWGLLAKGEAASAAKLAAELLAKHPRNTAVLVLAIDAAAAGTGAMAALDIYERWLGSRKLENPHALQRVARALLRSVARGHSERARRLEAVEALIRDGQTDAASLLPAGDSDGPIGDRLRSATGNEDAVAALLTELKEPGPAKRGAILALGRSGSPRAIPELVAVLGDADPVARASAAEALGALGARQAVPPLRSALQDPVFHVRVAAATALAALKDESGLAWLRPLLSSEHAGVRVAAARAAKEHANAEWVSVVRALTKESDPEIRRQAAELIAPHDPELASETLEPLLTDPNPAMRQAAADSAAAVTSDFAVLRRFLRSTDTGTQVRAADRVLTLTR